MDRLLSPSQPVVGYMPECDVVYGARKLKLNNLKCDQNVSNMIVIIIMI